MATSSRFPLAAVAVGLLAMCTSGFAQQERQHVALHKSDPPTLVLRETWQQTGEERDIEPGVVTGPNLELKLYGPSAHLIQIAPNKANPRHDPPNLWTGSCTTPVAATLRDKTRLLDLSGRATIRWNVRTAGFHQVRPVVKLADGTWLVGDHADGDGSTENFLLSEFAVSSVRWLRLDIEHVTTLHADKSQPPEIGRWVMNPDLTKVDEVGFADLMPGSGHGWTGFVNFGAIEVYGKASKR
jgi:hypothetical protein